ncbi:hypothetical protein SAMN02949497_1929 [Methylomagnum ishizawai]|uniref:Uncharacterized protein n=1 Tax=Methylomagnum ishizawai TaxID=1760988 RepID=A0A1Y6CVE9_9GAMM|nr:hypothetical protein [Methylomagnum ishizawai]SMF94608.1 hypothetical protein SAMN02949497_1929 [Methylomagnum ishizawai]
MQNVKTPAERDALKPVLAVHVEADDSWDCYLPGDELPAMPSPLDSIVATPSQFRLALLQSGLLDAVEAYVATQPRPTQIEYEYAPQIHSQNPLIVAAAQALGLTDGQRLALFQLAVTL